MATSRNKIDNVLGELREQLKQSEERYRKKQAEIDAQRDSIDEAKRLAEDVSQSLEVKEKELKGKLPDPASIPKIISSLDVLRTEANNDPSDDLEGVKVKVEGVRNDILNLGRNIRRWSLVDAVTYKTVTWAGSFLLLGSVIAGAYLGFDAYNTRKEKSVVEAQLRESEKGREGLYQRVSTPSRIVNSDISLVDMVEGTRQELSNAKTLLTEKQGKVLVRVTELEGIVIARDKKIETQEGELRTKDAKIKEISDANRLWAEYQKRIFASVSTVSGRTVQTDAQLTTFFNDLSATKAVSKELYDFMEENDFGTVQDAPGVKGVFERLLSEKKLVYSALSSFGVTESSSPQDVQRAIQKFINDRTASERKLQGSINTIGGEKTVVENKLQAVYAALTPIGVTSASSPQDVQTKVQTIVNEKASLEQRLAQLTGNTWELEYHDYLARPWDHVFKSVEVLKKHSERVGVVAILEDKIRMTDGLKATLTNNYGWRSNDPNKPVEMYVQNGDFVVLTPNTLLVNNGATLFGELQNLLGIPAGSDLSTLAWVKKDRNNIYICSNDKTVVRFASPSDGDKRFDSFDASFLGTSRDGGKSVLGVEDGGPFVYIVDKTSPADVKKMSCTGLWAPWRERINEESGGGVTRDFAPSLRDTNKFFFTAEKRGPAIGIDLGYDSNIQSLDLDTVRRFNDAWMSMSIGAIGRFTDIFESKNNSSLPASIKTVKSETSTKSTDNLNMTYATLDVVSFTMFPTRLISPYVSIGVPLSQTRMTVGSKNITPGQFMNDRDVQAFPLSGGLKIGGAKGEVFPYGRFYWGLDYHVESLSQVVVRDSKGVQVASGDGLVHGLGFEFGFLLDDGLHPKHPYNTGRFRIHLGGGWNIGKLDFEDGTNKRTSSSVLTPVDSSLGKIDIEGTYGVIGIDFEF